MTTKTKDREGDLALAELARRADEFLPQYRPNAAAGHNQYAIHQSKAAIRLVTAGNGTGKTLMSTAEASCAVTGEQPGWLGQKYPEPPLTVWIVKQQYGKGIQTHKSASRAMTSDAVLQKLLVGDEYVDPHTQVRVKHGPMIAPRFEPMWNAKDHVIYLKNGSMIELRSAESGAAAMAGQAVDLVVIDEPIEESIWKELLARGIRRGESRILYSMTPVDMALGYLDDLMENGDPDIDVETFHMDTTKNPFLDRKRTSSFVATLTEDERATRVEGVLSVRTGLIYPEWDNWVEPFEIPKQATHYVVHDPGISNPAATLWMFIVPKGDIYIYDCDYDESHSSSVKPICERILAKTKYPIYRHFIDPWAGAELVPTVRDPRHEQTRIQLYRNYIRFQKGPTKKDEAGRLQRILATKQHIDRNCTAAPNIFAFDIPEMAPLRKEFRLYRWAKIQNQKVSTNKPEKPHNKDDHLMYCLEVPCSIRLKYQPNIIYPEHNLYDAREHISNVAQQMWTQAEVGAGLNPGRIRAG